MIAVFTITAIVRTPCIFIRVFTVRILGLSQIFWVGLFAARLIVQYPLYLSGNVNLLGTARLIMGFPLFAVAAWLTWQVVKSGPKLREDLRPT